MLINKNYKRNKFSNYLIAARQSGFIVPCVWEIVVRKNLAIFKGCHFAQFYILIWWSFPKIETKNFNSGLHFCKLVKLGTISPAVHFLNCVPIGRSQTIAAIVCGLSGKRFVKLRDVFQDFKITNIGRSYREMPWKADTEAYLCFYWVGKSILCFYSREQNKINF